MDKFEKIPLFEQDARVVFIGSSTVASGLFIAKIFDFYRTYLPERRVKFYNFGVPGETAGGFWRTKRYELLLDLKPTEVVLMFGMNDIGRDNYKAERRNEKKYIDAAEQCKLSHIEYTKKIGEFLREHNLPITLCSTQSYDEVSDVAAESLTGCQDAVARLFYADIEALSPYGLKGAINMCEPMFELLKGVKERGLPSFIGSDRVHPTKVGHDIMARIILNAQGLIDKMPTVDDIADESVALPPLSEENQKRKAIEELWRSPSYLDFVARWGQENMTAEERCAYWAERIKTMTEADGYKYTVAKTYPERKSREKEYFAELMHLTDEMYK
jgi:lysophospholipase L1-like esterase